MKREREAAARGIYADIGDRLDGDEERDAELVARRIREQQLAFGDLIRRLCKEVVQDVIDQPAVNVGGDTVTLEFRVGSLNRVMSGISKLDLDALLDGDDEPRRHAQNPERDATIRKMRRGGMKLEEIACEFGLSRERVRQICRRAERDEKAKGEPK